MTLAPRDSAPQRPSYASEYLEAGSSIADKYTIESVLGEGATSVVYVARRRAAEPASFASPAASEMQDEDSNPPEQPSLVALKIIHTSLCEDPQIVGRFQREAAILKRLDGPHVLRVYETLTDHGRLVLVLEYVRSKPLDRRLAEDDKLSVAASIEIALQVCAGLAAAHAAGVVHRDLKPANVLYATDGDDDHVLVKVADFGLAKLVHGDKMMTGLTEHDMIFGTPEYMAPEQARGEEVDARADIYALGCMLYEMLTGTVPFHGHSPMVTMTAHLMHEVEPLRKRRSDGAISPALEAVVMRALSKSPAERQPSARAFAEALLAAKSDPLIINTTAPADALGDTDLNVASPALAEALARDAAMNAPPTSGRSETPVVNAIQPEPPPPVETAPQVDLAPLTVRAGPRWLWIAVALLAALVGIGIGIVAGTR